MKNKFLIFTLMLCLLMLASPVYAETVETQFGETFTADEFYNIEIPSSGSYGTIAKVPSSAKLTVVDDGTGNFVYQMGGSTVTQAMIIYTYYSSDGSLSQSRYQKMTARIMLPSKTGRTHLFAMERGWGVAVNTDTAGVVLENGGAYYYDAPSGEYVNFIPDNTMSVGEWYTVEAIFDFTACSKDAGDIVMYGTVTDDEGNVLGTSGRVHVSNQKSYNDNALMTYIRSQIRFSGYAEGENVFIDDLKLFKLAVTPITCTPGEITEESASFTFSEALDPDTVTKENIRLTAENPALDVSDKYEIEYADGTLTLNFDELPYGEAYNITITTDVRAEGDAFGLPAEIVLPFTTPVDPLASATGTADFIVGDGSVVAKVTLNNTALRSREYMLVVTSWNSDNVCVDIKNVSGTLAPEDTEEITLPAVTTDGSGSIIRLSLLDNWYSITPIGDVAIEQLP